MKTKLTVSLVILRFISYVYFMNEAKKPDYKIAIGIPVNSAEAGSSGFDFSESKPLKKESASDVMFKLENEKGMEYRENDNLYYVMELEKIIKAEMDF